MLQGNLKRAVMLWNPEAVFGADEKSVFLDSETKWALWNGVSSRPLMPVAVKMLLSKKPLKEDAALKTQLKLSKEDISRMKYYNMFSVV